MIALSAGMLRSGTAWYFNLANALMVAAGHQDAREIRRTFHLESVLRHANCNIGRLSVQNLFFVLLPHILGNSFVIKTHSAPTRSLKMATTAGIVKPIWLFRDPRDVVVSLYEASRTTKVFADMSSVDAAVTRVKSLLRVWDRWMCYDNVLVVRYEDMTKDAFAEMTRMCNYLGLDVSSDRIDEIVAGYSAARLGDSALPKAKTHLNKGVVGRYRTVLSPDQVALCHEQFGDHLVRMGYAESVE